MNLILLFQKYLFSISFGISLDKLASLLYLTKLRFFVSAALTCGDSTRVFCFSTQCTKPGCHFARVQCISGHSCLPPCCWYVFPNHNTTIPHSIIGQGVAGFVPPRPSQIRQLYFFRFCRAKRSSSSNSSSNEAAAKRFQQ